MYRAEGIRLTPVIASSLMLVACGSQRASGYDIARDEEAPVEATELELSELELAIVRSELGPLPPTPPPDPGNRYDDDPAAAILGQKLFFEKGYSQNGLISCATCHSPERGFQDDRANTSEGLAFTDRHASTLLNVAYGSGAPGATLWQFWDGRKDSLWSQALGPPESSVEMGAARTRVALLILEKYATAYEALFGALPPLLDPDGMPLVMDTAKPNTSEWEMLDESTKSAITQVYVNFGKAVAAYERRIISRNAPFDAFWQEIAGGATQSDLLSPGELGGLKLFIGKGGCISCHQGPNFSDWKFHNIGVPQDAANVRVEDRGREEGVAAVLGDEFNCASGWSDRVDKEGCAVSTLAAESADLGAFKTPTLRNVSRTAPYFHTGAVQTLEEVIEFYDQGGAAEGYVGNRDDNIVPLELTADEKKQLLDFLKTLEGEAVDPSLSVDLSSSN
jgi:cytochrome c peroxidase